MVSKHLLVLDYQILIFDGYVKVRIFVYPGYYYLGQFHNHIDWGDFAYLQSEGSCVA